MTACGFAFGGTQYERIEVTILGYERQPSGDRDDDNWLTVQVSISAGGFRGSFGASFRTVEIVGFRDQLAKLCETLKGRAVFDTIENQLMLQIDGNGLGSMQVSGEAWDESSVGNQLKFEIRTDQTDVAAALRDVNAVIQAFPIR